MTNVFSYCNIILSRFDSLLQVRCKYLPPFRQMFLSPFDHTFSRSSRFIQAPLRSLSSNCFFHCQCQSHLFLFVVDHSSLIGSSSYSNCPIHSLNWLKVYISGEQIRVRQGFPATSTCTSRRFLKYQPGDWLVHYSLAVTSKLQVFPSWHSLQRW